MPKARLLTMLMACAGVVASCVLNTSPAAAQSTGLMPGFSRVSSHGPYLIKNDFNGMCVDVAFGSRDNGARVQQWDCYGGPPEQWYQDFVEDYFGTTYYRFRNANSGKCLDVPYGSTIRGVELQQWDCWGSGGYMQQWRLLPVRDTASVWLVNRSSGLCLDDKDWSTTPGTSLQQWSRWDAPVQQWKLYSI